MLQLFRLLLQSLIDPKCHLSLLKHLLKFSYNLSLLSDSFHHMVHFFYLLLLGQELLSISNELVVEVSLVLFNLYKAIHSES